MGAAGRRGPKKKQTSCSFFYLQLLHSSGGQRGREGGCANHENQGLGPVDGEGLRLRACPSQSVLLSVRGREALRLHHQPPFPPKDPTTTGSQPKDKTGGGGYNLLAKAARPTQSMQDRQIHVIFGGSRRSGQARSLHTAPLSSQPSRSRQKAALRMRPLLLQPASVGPLALPPFLLLPPLHPLVPASSLLPPSRLRWWLVAGGVGGQKPCFAGGVKETGQRDSYWRQPPHTGDKPSPSTLHSPHTHLQTYNPGEPPKIPPPSDLMPVAWSLLSSLWSPPPHPQTTDEQIDRHSLYILGFPGPIPSLSTDARSPALGTHIYSHTLSLNTGLNTRETRPETVGEWPCLQAVDFIPIFFLLLFFFLLSFFSPNICPSPSCPS